jgi:hypothetical protein
MLSNSFENKLTGSDKTLDILNASFRSNEVSAKASSVLQMSQQTKTESTLRVSSFLEWKVKKKTGMYFILLRKQLECNNYVMGTKRAYRPTVLLRDRNVSVWLVA